MAMTPEEENKALREKIELLEREAKARDEINSKIAAGAQALADMKLGEQTLADIKQGNIAADAEYYASQVRLAQHFGDSAKVRQMRAEQYKKVLEQQQLAMKKGSEVEANILARLSDEDKKRYAEDAEFKKKKIKEVLKGKIKMTDDELKVLEKAHEEEERLANKNYRTQKQEAQSLISSVSKSVVGFDRNQYKKSGFGMISEIGNMARTEGGLKGLMEEITETFKIQNILSAVVSKLYNNFIEFSKAIDQVSSATAALTGDGQRQTGMFIKLSEQNRINGISAEDTARAYQGLTTSFIGFNAESHASRMAMAGSAAQLQKLGVDAGTSGETMAFFAKNVGMSGAEAAKMGVKVAMMARTVGMNVGKFTKEFNASLKVLSVYGDKSVEVFHGLASAAQAAGVEVGTLLNLAKGFDTFEGAASTVGKLNALMGTQLNASSMLMMTEDKRIETLIQTVQAQGTAFKDLNKFEQQAIAAAAGISDMNEAQKIFGMNAGQYAKFAEENQLAEDAQRKLEDAMRKATPIVTKLKMLFTEFMITFEGIIDPVSDFITKIHELIQENRELFKGFIVITGILSFAALLIGTLVFAFGGLFILILNVASSLSNLGVSFSFLGGTVEKTGDKVGEGMNKMSKGARKAINNLSKSVSKGMKSLATGVQAGFTALMKGLSSGLKAIGNPAVLKGIGILAALLAVLVLAAIGFAYALSLAEPGIRAVGDAIIGIIGGISGLISENGIGALAGLMGIIYLSMVGFMLLAKPFSMAMGIMALGVGALALSIAALGVALAFLPKEILQSVSALATGLAEFDGAKVETGFAAMSTFVNNLDSKSDSVKPMLTNLAVMTTGTSAETGAAGVIGAAVIGLGKAIGDLGKQGQEMVVKLDGDATAKLMRGEAVKVMVGQNVQYG